MGASVCISIMDILQLCAFSPALSVLHLLALDTASSNEDACLTYSTSDLNSTIIIAVCLTLHGGGGAFAIMSTSPWNRVTLPSQHPLSPVSLSSSVKHLSEGKTN